MSSDDLVRALRILAEDRAAYELPEEVRQTCGNAADALSRPVAAEQKIAHQAATIEQLRGEVERKESDRQYHMNAINRLAKFLGFRGTSDDVIEQAADIIKRFIREREQAEASVKVLEAALETDYMYSDHTYSCAFRDDNDAECTCGYDRAAALYRKAMFPDEALKEPTK